MASLSIAVSSGDVIVLHAAIAPMEPCPGPIIGWEREYLYWCFEMPYPVLILCSMLYSVFSQVRRLAIVAPQTRKQLRAKAITILSKHAAASLSKHPSGVRVYRLIWY